MKFAAIEHHSAEAQASGNDLKTACVCCQCGRTSYPANNEREAILFAMAQGWHVKFNQGASISKGQVFQAPDFCQLPDTELFCKKCGPDFVTDEP